ncbi:MAG: amidohydrolase [Ardenticatenales bacterium]
MRTPTTFIVRRARIHRFDGAEPATALAVREGRIVAIGSDQDVWRVVGSDTPAVDLRGLGVLPGLIDAHIHWGTYAIARRNLQIGAEDTLPEVLRRVRQRASEATPGQWIIGRGWDHQAWGRWPTGADLDGVAAAHPVALTRKDGHAIWLNSAALAACGIDAATEDPAGGAIQRSDGQPTGILMETALRIVHTAIPPLDTYARQAAMIEAWRDAWCRGLTGMHDMGYQRQSLFRDLATLRDAGELGLRFVWYLPQDELEESIGLGLRSGLGDGWLRVGGLKLFLDGTLGSQTAHMLAPYEAQPDNLGLATLDADTFAALTGSAAEAGLATAVHAIGDHANRIALDGFAAVNATVARAASLRQRIEHVQTVDPADVPRFHAQGVVASMQPIHCTSDMAVADRFWGARTANSYAWQSILRTGAGLAFGSDAPIETLDVFAGVHAAVTRQNASSEPRGGWHPEQRLTVRQALHAYTAGAAFAAGMENEVGALSIGCQADLIVVDRDPLAIEPAELLDLKVLGTMIEGVWVWQSPGAAIAGPRHEP